MDTTKHNAMIQEWFGNLAPTHYFHDGQGTAWYVFRNDNRYLIMLSKQDSQLRAVGIADKYREVTDLYNWIKVQHPTARWVH